MSVNRAIPDSNIDPLDNELNVLISRRFAAVI
jgi:hypothetical protein